MIERYSALDLASALQFAQELPHGLTDPAALDLLPPQLMSMGPLVRPSVLTLV
jgi:hypothetical protein